MNPAVSVSMIEYVGVVLQTTSALASGLSEAASRYAEWIRQESLTRIVSAEEGVSRLISELRPAYQTAADNARIWSDAANAAGDTGIGRIMDRYAQNFADRAANLAGEAS
jgi:hypothetical protein